MKKTALLSLMCLAVTFSIPAFSPAFAKAKKPDSKLQSMLRLYAYEKSTDVVSDVSGIFDAKAQKVTLKCELKNTTKKEIHGVRGFLRFTTFFGDVITDQSLETTVSLPPGQLVGVNWDIPAERFTPEALETFKKTKLDQMRQIWYPKMIAYTDGTVVKE